MEYIEEQAMDYLNSLDARKREPELIKCDFCFEQFEPEQLFEMRSQVFAKKTSITYVEQCCKGCLVEMRKWESENNV
jgi:hypothetical protein